MKPSMIIDRFSAIICGACSIVPLVVALVLTQSRILSILCVVGIICVLLNTLDAAMTTAFRARYKYTDKLVESLMKDAITYKTETLGELFNGLPINITSEKGTYNLTIRKEENEDKDTIWRVVYYDVTNEESFPATNISDESLTKALYHEQERLRELGFLKS